MNTLERLEKEEIERLTASRGDTGPTVGKAPGEADFPDFRPGDSVRVRVRIVEGSSERIQNFEGVCIARRRAGLRSNFTVRKVSYGEGVERVFQLYSPRLAGIELLRRGRVRRSKLYYLRQRSGRSARIAEKKNY